MHVRMNHYTKVIKNIVILDDVSLSLERGHIYGLYGKNGSGKTMLLRAISGLIHPTRGEVIIDEKVLHKDMDFPENTGIIIENLSLYPQYSAYQNLYLLSKIQKKASREDIITTLKKVGLDPYNKNKIKTYSLGMKQKLNIAQAIFENQDLILLDEPTNGLDDQSIENIYQLFHELASQDKTIVIASHDKEDLLKHCDQIFRVSHGKVIKEIEKNMDI